MKILFILMSLIFTTLTLAQDEMTAAANLAAQTLSNSNILGNPPGVPCEACVGFSKNIQNEVRLQASNITDLNQFRFYTDPGSSVCDDNVGRTGTYLINEGTHIYPIDQAKQRKDQAVGSGPVSQSYGEFKPDSNDIVRKISDLSTLQTDLRIFVPITSYSCEPYTQEKCSKSSYSDDRNDPNMINFPEAPCGGVITYNFKNGEKRVINTYPAALMFKQECQRAQLQVSTGSGGVCLSFKSDSDTNTRNDRSVSPPVELDYCLDNGFLGTEQACVGEPVISPDPAPEPASRDCCKNGAAGSTSLCTNKDVPNYSKFTFHVMRCTGTGTWGPTLAIVDCRKKPECCDIEQYKTNAAMCTDYAWKYGKL